MENNPRAVFERMFGASDTTDPATGRRGWRRTGAFSISWPTKVQA